MSLYGKLLEMQRRVDGLIKDGRNVSDKYDFASDENVLDRFRPIMDELGLLLIPSVRDARVHEGTTRSGTARFLTEVFYTMTWRDTESGETLEVPWYAQGVDLAGEKGVGKAATYGEKYFFLKFFHIPTRKDDPDSDRHTGNREKARHGTAASRENEAYFREVIPRMLGELYSGDKEKIRAAYVFYTKAPSRGYEGVDSLEKIGAAALPVLYGKLKKVYAERMGREFKMEKTEP